jgi:hypothetical protein
MQAPRLSEKVRRGLWLIVARSATVWSWEQISSQETPRDQREERECVLAAAKYAEHHWKQEPHDGEAA